MRVPLFRAKHWWTISVVIILIATVGVAWRITRPEETANTTHTTLASPARDTYAALYEALWRIDDTPSNSLVTATLVLPPMVTALGADTARSDAEDRLYRVLKALTDRQIAILLTFDSVAGAVPDAAIKGSLQLKAVPDQKTSVVTWQPLIAAPRLVNAPAGTTSQFGLAVFQTEQPLSWDQLQSVQLTVTNIGDQPPRQFSWSSIPLLLAVE